MKHFRAWTLVQEDGGVPVHHGCIPLYFDRATALEQRNGGERVVNVLVLPRQSFRSKPSAEDVKRNHEAAIRVAKRVLRRDGYSVRRALRRRGRGRRKG